MEALWSLVITIFGGLAGIVSVGVGLLSIAQVVVVPLIARSKNLGCGIWLLVTILWVGIGFGAFAALGPVLLAAGGFAVGAGDAKVKGMGALAILVGAGIVGFSLLPFFAVKFTPARDSEGRIVRERRGRRVRPGRWRRRIG